MLSLTLELINLLMPLLVGAPIVLYPMWKTRSVKGRTVAICLSVYILFALAMFWAARRHGAPDFAERQALRIYTVLPYNLLPFFVFRRRFWQNVFLFTISAMYSPIYLGLGLYAGENWIIPGVSAPLLSAAVSFAVTAVTLPPLLFSLRRMYENPQIEQAGVFWRLAWLLPAMYFWLFMFSNDQFNAATFTGINFIVIRALLYSVLIITCFLFDVALRQAAEAEEAKRHEQITAADNAALDRLNRMKADLIATVTHETMTPLAVLSVYSELIARELRGKGVDEQTAKDIETIAEETQRIKWLMDELQNHAREQGNELLKTRLNLSEVIENAARLYTPILKRKNIELRVNTAGLPDVYACANEVTQVFFNLLQNTRDHAENCEAAINAEADGGYVSVTVSDTGGGIRPELLPRAFERGVSGGEGGTGLGLWICGEIIKKHGGAISIESGPGEGTSVRFTLPKWKGDARDG